MMKKIVATVIVAAVCFGGGIFVGMQLANKDVHIDSDVIMAKLSECNDLASTRFECSGLIKYEEGNLIKTGFSMTYDAYVKAGIDLSKADVPVNGNKVTVNLPKSKILEVLVDESSLQFYDKKFALLNRTNEDDTNESLKVAKNAGRNAKKPG